MNQMMNKQVIIVAGPTASGKSELGLLLARQMNGVIINADSMQVYRELPILTAQPGKDDLGLADHRLYGTLSAAEACSVGRWRSMAVQQIDRCHAEGRTPLILGGTGLYIKALMEGLSPVPEISIEFRVQATEDYDKLGPVGLVEKIRGHDPHMAQALRANDRQRIIRAWEVWLATGKSLLQWQHLHPPVAHEGYDFHTVLLCPERDLIYQRCDQRFEKMIAEGGVEEVQSFLSLELSPSLPLMRAIGVIEIKNYLNGEWTFEQMVAASKQATRRYAKRQLTWLRNQLDFEIKLQSVADFETLNTNNNNYAFLKVQKDSQV
jgi:tRNA dimethylallyltransferase